MDLASSHASLSSSTSSHFLDTVSHASSKSGRVQRSQSTHSKKSSLPSLQEQEDNISPYENHSVIQLAKEEIREETEEELKRLQVRKSKGSEINEFYRSNLRLKFYFE